MTEGINPQHFWQDLPRPFIALAPMEDVTDTVFRELVLGISSPGALHVVFSEFTSTDGLCHEKGKIKVMERLRVNATERSLLRKMNIRLVAQIWGSDPGAFYRSARMISEEFSFDGIDINMGCPVKKIVKQGACSALIKKPALAKEIIQATLEGSTLPVSVKTRIGFSKIQTEEWVGHLLETGISALTLHGRIQKVDSEGPVHWEEIARAARMKETQRPGLVMIGNGDVLSLEDAREKSEAWGLDGIMIGRGVFHNPWIFNPLQEEHPPEEKVRLLIRHIRLFHETWGSDKNFDVLKRFFKIYLNAFPGAARLRAALMESREAEEATDTAERYLQDPQQLMG